MPDFEVVLKQLLETAARRVVSFLRSGTEEAAAGVRRAAKTGRKAYQRSGRWERRLPWFHLVIGVVAVGITYWGITVAQDIAKDTTKIQNDIAHFLGKVSGDPGPAKYIVHFGPIVEKMVKEGKCDPKEWLAKNAERKDLAAKLVLEKEDISVIINKDGSVDIESSTDEPSDCAFQKVVGSLGIDLGVVFDKTKSNYLGWLKKYLDDITDLHLTIRYRGSAPIKIVIPKEQLREKIKNAGNMAITKSDRGIVFPIGDLVEEKLKGDLCPAREISFEASGANG